MKTISAALKAHMQQGNTTIATLLRIERRDGVELFFTDHDVDIEYPIGSGDVYESATGAVPSGIAQDSEMNVDGMEIMTFIDSTKITEDDVRGGRYSAASVDVMIVNWSDLSQGAMYLAQGWQIGNISMNDQGEFVCELNGLMERLQNDILELTSPNCRAKFGDARCGLDLDALGYYHDGYVAYAVDNRSWLDLSVASGVEDDSFRFGTLVFNNDSTGGANAGIAMMIKKYSSGLFEMVQSMPFTIAVGDNYRAYFGCAKDRAACIAYGNIVNMRAEPDLPGMDRVLSRKG